MIPDIGLLRKPRSAAEWSVGIAESRRSGSVGDSSIVGRIPTPGRPRALAIDATAAHLYVALGAQVGVIDLPTRTFSTTIALSAVDSLTDIIVGSPGRLYAVNDSAVFIVDTDAGSE